MAGRRAYTGTQRLQLAWSLGIVAVVGIALGVNQWIGLPVSVILVLVLLSVSWFFGLGLLGFRDRRQWNKLVERSSFSRQTGPHAADLEKIVEGRSVTVSTTVPGILSQTHTELRTTVADVETSFSVRLERVQEGGFERGVETGTEALDQQYVIEGSEANVSRVLSADVQSALLDIDTPGVCTVTGEYVSFVVPFTSLSADELDTIAIALVAIAARVEEVGDASS